MDDEKTRAQKGFDTFVKERVKKEGASKLWNHDDDNVWNLFDEAEAGEDYLGDDGSGRVKSAFVDKAGKRRKLQSGVYPSEMSEGRRKPLQLTFRLDGELKKKLDIVCITTRQTIGEVLRAGIQHSYDQLRELKKQIIEERAVLEQMLKEKNEYSAHKVSAALKEKAPWRVAERQAIANGVVRSKAVQAKLSIERSLRRRKVPLTPEQEAKRAKNMAEIEAKLEKKREVFRRYRARKREAKGGEGFVPEKRLNPPPNYDDE